MTEPDAGNTGPSPRPPDRDERQEAATWDTWEADLARVVTTLADGEALTITSTRAHSRPVLVRKGFLRGFVPAKHEEVEPWVRLVRLEDHVRGTCVGSEGSGGRFPFSPEEDAALVDIGWRRPGAGDGTDYLRFWPDDVAQGPFLPIEEAQRVGAMVGRTFREVLAPSDPEASDAELRPGHRDIEPRPGHPDADTDAGARAPALALPTMTRGPAPPLPPA